jgi:hypothetical protein
MAASRAGAESAPRRSTASTHAEEAGLGAADVGRIRASAVRSSFASVLDKVRAVRKLIDATGKPIRLEIDGA